MLIVFVKHYLNKEGIRYFEQQWFPAVQQALQQQPGFISICYDKGTDTETLHITLKFADQSTLDNWTNTQIHDDLVDLLDPYRSKNYWEVSKVETDDPDLSGDAVEDWRKILVEAN